MVWKTKLSIFFYPCRENQFCGLFTFTKKPFLLTTVGRASYIPMATAAFILGPEKGIALLERDNCEGLIIYAEDGRTEGGRLLMAATSGFSKYLPNPDLEGLPLP